MFNTIEDQITLVKETVKNKLKIDQLLTNQDHQMLEQIIIQDETIRNFTNLNDYFNVVEYFMRKKYQPNDMEQMITALGQMNHQLTRKGLNRHYDVASGMQAYQTIFDSLKNGKLKNPVQELADWKLMTDCIEEPRTLCFLTESIFHQLPVSTYSNAIHTEDPAWIEAFVTAYQDSVKRRVIINNHQKSYRPKIYKKQENRRR